MPQHPNSLKIFFKEKQFSHLKACQNLKLDLSAQCQVHSRMNECYLYTWKNVENMHKQAMPRAMRLLKPVFYLFGSWILGYLIKHKGWLSLFPMFGIFIKPLPCMDSLIKDEQILHLLMNRSIDGISLLSSPFPMILKDFSLWFWSFCQICLAKVDYCGRKWVRKTETAELRVLF